MAPIFANASCDPFTPKTLRCTLGNYVDYAINVSNPADILRGIAFAKSKNIRFVIRNTGHDYLGKSTGSGALSVWTHHLKTVEFLDYQSPHYKGPAIKMGAGVQAFEAYAAADQRGLTVVGGECSTVGLAGGYTQGGGHSALSSTYGMAADQTLEWEVVTGDGQLIRASRTRNSDIYWALSGGGGGTYGVVYSLTAKAHKDIPVAGLNLTFTSAGISTDTFYKAIGYYHALLPNITRAGGMSIHVIRKDLFSITPITFPGASGAIEVQRLLQPFTEYLTRLGIKYNLHVIQFPDYLSEYYTMIPSSLTKVGVVLYGGRLIPHSVVENNNDAITTVVRNIAEDEGGLVVVGVDVSMRVAGDVYNAVLPAWRDTALDLVLTSPWNATAPFAQEAATQNRFTNDWIPQLAALTPGGGSYLNEADFQEPDWKNTFYGSNYERLLAIKNKYDPDHLFYATTAVGSDYWTVKAGGRLCRA
ncbi:MAG: hypothetical protein Q9187_005943, partial [Circinaria calcarea]